MLQMYYRLLKHKIMLYVSLESLKVTSTVLGTYCVVKKIPTRELARQISHSNLTSAALARCHLLPQECLFPFSPSSFQVLSIRMTLQLQRSKI